MEDFGCLYIVGTPIGNLSDMPERAIDTLKHSDIIACEDTRTSGNLMKKFDIQTKLSSFHQHNEHKKTPEIIRLLLSGKKVSLISDAGMPAISDPGFLLTREAHKNGITVVPIPGPNAAVTALAASGLPSDRFIFEGFLPQKKGRKTRIMNLTDETRTIIFYESPYRVVRLLKELADSFGPDRLAVVARELTKKFEEIRRASLSALVQDFETRTSIKGEFVVIVAGKDYTEEEA
jgi:16S rRNA (cytidine1402-2'-O)-methyltransferase